MFKILLNNCCGLDVHKTWIYACVGITDAKGRTNYFERRFSSFTKDLEALAGWLRELQCVQVCMESAGKYWIPVFNILEKTVLVTLAHPKYTKPQQGNKTDRKDARWICDLFMCGMVKPSFIPPQPIRNLRELVRYRAKLIYAMSAEKNRMRNCLTVSNLKLDDVFSDVFGKSSMSITKHILEHPGECFDVAPFVDPRCSHSMDEIQAAVQGAISHEQSVKLRTILAHIDHIEEAIQTLEEEIFRLATPFQTFLDLLHTVPGFSANPMTAIIVLSEIGADMSVFPTAKHLCSWGGCCPRNDQSGGKIKSTRISHAGAFLKPLLVQIASSIVRSNKYPEIKERYRRIKARRGHKKAIIAICRMFLTSIWNMLTDLVPYNPKGLVPAHSPSREPSFITRAQAEAILRREGYVVIDPSPPLSPA